MPKEKISAETTVMLTMQKLISAADEAFDCFEDKDDDTFMSIVMTPDYIWCDLLKEKKCKECGTPAAVNIASISFNRKTKLSRIDK